MYWIIICLVNYILSLKDKPDKRIKVIKFKRNIKSNLIKKNESPARILSDMFWLSFPWKEYAKIIKKKLNIIEVGCGDGRYGFLLKKILKNSFNNYLGIDINKKKTWSEKKQGISFVKLDCYKIGKYLSNKNLIITQSALEHFKYDLKFFEIIKKNLPQKKKIIQIHLIPSYNTLFTYFWHGYRHYNLNTISKITKIFNDKSQFKLFLLGSAKLNWFHFRHITLTKNRNLKLKKDKKNYFRLLNSLLSQNSKSKDMNSPTFYALVILHNFKKI